MEVSGWTKLLTLLLNIALLKAEETTRYQNPISKIAPRGKTLLPMPILMLPVPNLQKALTKNIPSQVSRNIKPPVTISRPYEFNPLSVYLPNHLKPSLKELRANIGKQTPTPSFAEWMRSKNGIPPIRRHNPTKVMPDYFLANKKLIPAKHYKDIYADRHDDLDYKSSFENQVSTFSKRTGRTSPYKTSMQVAIVEVPKNSSGKIPIKNIHVVAPIQTGEALESDLPSSPMPYVIGNASAEGRVLLVPFPAKAFDPTRRSDEYYHIGVPLNKVKERRRQDFDPFKMFTEPFKTMFNFNERPPLQATPPYKPPVYLPFHTDAELQGFGPPKGEDILITPPYIKSQPTFKDTNSESSYMSYQVPRPVHVKPALNAINKPPQQQLYVRPVTTPVKKIKPVKWPNIESQKVEARPFSNFFSFLSPFNLFGNSAEKPKRNKAPPPENVIYKPGKDLSRNKKQPYSYQQPYKIKTLKLPIKTRPSIVKPSVQNSYNSISQNFHSSVPLLRPTRANPPLQIQYVTPSTINRIVNNPQPQSPHKAHYRQISEKVNFPLQESSSNKIPNKNPPIKQEIKPIYRTAIDPQQNPATNFLYSPAHQETNTKPKLIMFTIEDAVTNEQKNPFTYNQISNLDALKQIPTPTFNEITKSLNKLSNLQHHKQNSLPAVTSSFADQWLKSYGTQGQTKKIIDSNFVPYQPLAEVVTINPSVVKGALTYSSSYKPQRDIPHLAQTPFLFQIPKVDSMIPGFINTATTESSIFEFNTKISVNEQENVLQTPGENQFIDNLPPWSYNQQVINHNIQNYEKLTDYDHDTFMSDTSNRDTVEEFFPQTILPTQAAVIDDLPYYLPLVQERNSGKNRQISYSSIDISSLTTTTQKSNTSDNYVFMPGKLNSRKITSLPIVEVGMLNAPSGSKSEINSSFTTQDEITTEMIFQTINTENHDYSNDESTNAPNVLFANFNYTAPTTPRITKLDALRRFQEYMKQKKLARNNAKTMAETTTQESEPGEATTVSKISASKKKILKLTGYNTQPPKLEERLSFPVHLDNFSDTETESQISGSKAFEWRQPVLTDINDVPNLSSILNWESWRIHKKGRDPNTNSSVFMKRKINGEETIPEKYSPMYIGPRSL